MSEFLKQVQAAHLAHEKTLQHRASVAWGNTARQRLDAHHARLERKGKAA